MANIPTGGVLINDLPKASEIKSTDSMIIARDGLAYTAQTSALGEATTAVVSDAFSENVVYAKGSYCIYEDTLYKFTADKSAGEWDSSVVQATTVGAEVAETNTDVSELNSALADKASTSDLNAKIYTDYTTVNTSSSFGADAASEVALYIHGILSNYQPVNCVTNSSYSNVRCAVIGTRYASNRGSYLIMAMTSNSNYIVRIVDESSTSVVTISG